MERWYLRFCLLSSNIPARPGGKHHRDILGVFLSCKKVICIIQRHQTLRMLRGLVDFIGIFRAHDFVIGTVKYDKRLTQSGDVL